jgi:hypothetical protein
VKKRLRLLAVALLLTTIFVPLTAFADGDPTGPPWLRPVGRVAGR